MTIGEKVRIVRIPTGLVEETRSLFERCLGRIFPIMGIVPVPEIASEIIELHVGKVDGLLPIMRSIWIEKELVEAVASGRSD